MHIPTPLLYVFVPLFAVLALAALWMGAGSLLAWASGWRALAARYPGGELQPETLRSCSLTLARGPFAFNYNRSVRLSWGPSGLKMETLSLFCRAHRPVLLPWSALAGCARRKTLTGEVTALRVEEPAVEILVRGEAGGKLFAFWQSRSRGGAAP